MHLDYKDNRVNGNVVDFVITPTALRKNMDKYVKLLKVGFRGGMYQLQMNVVSSNTLVVTRKEPNQFPNLVVRMWGFSAYFKDPPDEYKDLLIRRAKESEHIA